MQSITSDLGLLREIRKYGRFDTNACLQCGSCTLSCELATDVASFPRRTIRYALLGLKKPLQGGLEPWLCYYCGDCSEACPREADPGEGMMTLRRYLTAQYDWTGLASRIYKSKIWHIGSLVGVAVLFLLGVYYYHVRWEQVTWADREFWGEEYLPYMLGTPMGHMFGGIALVTRLVVAAAALFLVSNAVHMWWMTMRRGASIKVPIRLYFAEVGTLIKHAFTQRRWRDCDERRPWLLHLVLMVGVVYLFVVVLFALPWFQTDTVHSFFHPQRLFGYLATIAMMVPLTVMLYGRIRRKRPMHRYSGATDWSLPIMLSLTALSGIALHIMRIASNRPEGGLVLETLYLYAIHMAIAVSLILIEIPFGKWSHMMYRPLAVYFQAVKERAMQEQVAGEAVVSHAS